MFCKLITIFGHEYQVLKLTSWITFVRISWKRAGNEVGMGTDLVGLESGYDGLCEYMVGIGMECAKTDETRNPWKNYFGAQNNI